MGWALSLLSWLAQGQIYFTIYFKKTRDYERGISPVIEQVYI